MTAEKHRPLTGPLSGVVGFNFTDWRWLRVGVAVISMYTEKWVTAGSWAVTMPGAILCSGGG
jgi:hypothetical protein